MSLVSTTIPNLINGVSQQPYALRLASQCEEQVNGHSSVVEGLQKRPPTRHAAKIANTPLSNAFIHTINRDQSEQYTVVITNGDLKVYDLNGVEKTVNFPEGKGYLASFAPDQEFTTVTVADFTFIVNKSFTVTTTEQNTPYRPNECLIWIKAPYYATNYNATVAGQAVGYTTELAGGQNATGNTVKTDHIAQQLENQLVSKGINAGNGYIIQRQGSVIYVAHHVNQFDAAVSDSQGDTAIKLIYGTVQRFSDLPAKAIDGFTCRVRGSSDTDLDDFYVTYEATPQSPFGGVWKEGAKPNEKNQIWKATMPHTLVREANGTFTFKPHDWDDRKVGDLESCPHPSFVGKQINDVFFHRNRLGVLSDENVIFSEAGEFFNFYPTSVMQTIDTDAIDVAASHTKVSILKAAVPFNESLLLFSEQTQFTLGRAELLTPKSVAINQSTEFNCDLRVKPVGVGSNVYFAQRRGQHSSIREFFVNNDTNSADATDVTSHVPSYVPKDIVKMAASSSEDLLAILSAQDRGTIYVYRFYWSNGQKMQSAWYKWSMPAGSSVLGMEFVESELVLVISRTDGVYIERMDLAPATTDDLGVPVHLDRRLTEANCTVSYNAGANTTTITIPWIAQAGETYQIVAHDGGPNQTYKAGVVAPYSFQNGNQFVVPGVITAFYIGVSYTFRYKFSTLVVREQAQGGGGLQAIGDGRVQVRGMSLGYSATGYFKVNVTPTGRSTYTYPFSGRILGSSNVAIGDVPKETGIFRFPVVAKNDQVSIEIVNDSYLPSSFLSGEWEAYFVLRSRRI